MTSMTLISTLSPTMLTSSAFDIVGRSKIGQEKLAKQQKELVAKLRDEVDALGIETDGKGWRARAYLYGVEARMPDGWMTCASTSWPTRKCGRCRNHRIGDR